MKTYELPTFYLQCFSSAMSDVNTLFVDATYDVLLEVIDFFDSDEESVKMGIDDYDQIKTFAECFNYMKGRIRDKFAVAFAESLESDNLIQKIKANHKLKKYDKLLLNCNKFELAFNKTLNVNIEEIYNITKGENETIEESYCN